VTLSQAKDSTVTPSADAKSSRSLPDQDQGAGGSASRASGSLTDKPTPAYTPPSYPEYSPTSYAKKDSVWDVPSSTDASAAGQPSNDHTPTGFGSGSAGFGGSRSASSGFPPSTDDSPRSSSGYSSLGSQSSSSPSPTARPSSIWTTQEPTVRPSTYSPSGTQRADAPSAQPATGGLGTVGAFGADAAGGVGAAAMAPGQAPGRVVASKSATEAPPALGDPTIGAAPTYTPSPSPSPSPGLPGPGVPFPVPGSPGIGSPGIGSPGPGAPGTKKRKPSSGKGKASVKSKTGGVRSPSGSLSGHAGAEGRRDAQLVLSRVEPWSVMKFSFIVSLVGWIVLFVAVALLYYALRAFGVFHFLESTVSTVTSGKGQAGANASTWFSASTVLGYTMLAGAINVILITALATVGSVVYNVVTHVSGGVEVTLREAD
jgi:hypothetical protein